MTLPANIAGGTSTTYNADNEQIKFNGASLTYDSDGQLTRDATNTYTFDTRHHLTAITGGVTASFIYDALGRRMKKVVAGTTTQFLYDGLNPVQELNSTNQVIANLMTGLRIDEFFTRTASSTTSTFLADALGSIVGLVSANNGPITTNYTYQPFGATTVGGAANGNSYEFTSRENDGNGLYFYRARYYSPSFQRFVAQDPLGFSAGETNLYSYAENSPFLLKDPSGTDVLQIGIGGAARKGGEVLGHDLGPSEGGSEEIAIAISGPWGKAPGPWGIGIVHTHGHCGSYNGAYAGISVQASDTPVPYISDLGNSIQNVGVLDTPAVSGQGGLNQPGAGLSIGPGLVGGSGTENQDTTVWWSTN